MRARGIATLLLSIACAACGDESPVAPTPPTPREVRLPAQMWLSASAQGPDGSQSISCHVGFAVTLREAGPEMHGTMGGDAQRSRLNPDGSGEAFWADAYYPEIRIDVDAAGLARLRRFHDGAPARPTGESRFWDRLITFEGAYDRAANTIAGRWTCGPLDVRTDTSGEVAGTWRLEPMP